MRKSIAGVAAAAFVGASAGALAGSLGQAVEAAPAGPVSAAATSQFRDALGPWTDWRVNSTPGSDGINLIAGGSSAPGCQPNAAWSRSSWFEQPQDTGTWKFPGYNGPVGEVQAFVPLYANNSMAQYRAIGVGRSVDQAAWRYSWTPLGGGYVYHYVWLSDRDYAGRNPGADVTGYDCVKITY